MCYCRCPYVNMAGSAVGECSKGFDRLGSTEELPKDAACYDANYPPDEYWETEENEEVSVEQEN